MVAPASLVKRPPQPIAPRPGLMMGDQFQSAYVTNDLDRACAVLGDRYGIGRFSFIDGEMPSGGRIRVAFAWVGATMYEIIDAREPERGFYTARLPESEFALRFHHLGFLVHSREGWDALHAEIAADGRPIVFTANTPGFLDAIYVEAPEFGHYLEYIFPEPGGIAFFESVPAN